MLKNRALLLAKPESTYGVDSVPTAALNAILSEVPEIEIGGRTLERNNVRAFFGGVTPVNIGETLKLTFVTELKGSGAAATPPEIGPLFKGCGMVETIGADVQYAPNSSAADSLSLYFHMHDILWKVLGARGTFSIEAKAGEYAKVNWEFSGLFAGPADVSIPTSPVFNSIVPPKVVSANFAFDAYAAIIESLKLTYGNEIGRRPDANHATGVREYFFRGRKVTGEFDPEMVALATYNFITEWQNSSENAVAFTVGQATGNRCTISMPKVSLSDVKMGERETLLIHSAAFLAAPDTGDDEVLFTFD